MNGELAEAGTLVAYGNAWLSRDKRTRDSILDFDNKNATFQYVRSVASEDDSGRARVGRSKGAGITRQRPIQEALADRRNGFSPYPVHKPGPLGDCASGHGMVEAWYGQWAQSRVDVQPTATNPRIGKSFTEGIGDLARFRSNRRALR